MAASSNDYFRRATSGTRPDNAYLTAQKTVGSTSIQLNTTNGWATTTGTDFVIFRKDTQDEMVPGTLTSWTGVVSGTNITNMILRAGTEPVGGYPQGEQSVVIATPTAAWNDALINGLLEEHKENGAHGDITADSLVLASPVDHTALPVGAVVQELVNATNTVDTGTDIIPLDDTIPQNTEGKEFITLAITPKSATNKLNIKAEIQCSFTVAADIVAALFRDSTADAITATAIFQSSPNGRTRLRLSASVTAGSTSATTFKVRAGGSVAGTITVNGSAGARLFGGINLSSITITEVKA